MRLSVFGEKWQKIQISHSITQNILSKKIYQGRNVKF